jgi:NADH:ubiquinone oxidoreductase subunit 4 (subunit M)
MDKKREKKNSYISKILNMLLVSLLIVPLIGIFFISAVPYNNNSIVELKQSKIIGLATSAINLAISLVVFILFNFSSNQFQFVQEYHRINSFDLYLGVDGISIYFVLLTTIIMPISLLSN